MSKLALMAANPLMVRQTAKKERELLPEKSSVREGWLFLWGVVHNVYAGVKE